MVIGQETYAVGDYSDNYDFALFKHSMVDNIIGYSKRLQYRK